MRGTEDAGRPPIRALAPLVDRAERLAREGTRRLLGIAGPPGAGKSQLAARLVAELPPGTATVVGMDGFHIADAELRRLGLRERKRAPETFDRAGFACLLTRLRTERGVVYVPVFDRDREDSTAAGAGVAPSIRLVVVEGNYLLHWPEVRARLDQAWYLDPPAAARRAALVARHVRHGRSEAQARRRADGSDERNARLVAAGRDRADEFVDWGDW
ncbi:MAG TPA: nucleoside/nucleotide kinase family protein [Jatrophihabitans sp.]|nr:nucleoside/nucleotide kinase family protein [Jatrophihabitans sp.]